ncbi:L-arabinose transport system permease protein AraQ [compost metagenome]
MVAGGASKKSKISFVDVMILIILLAFSFITLYPFLNLFFVSISNIKDVVENGGIILFPTNIDLGSYQYVFRHAQLLDAYGYTLLITVLGTLLNLAMTALGAYVLSTRELPGRNFLMTFVLITMFFSGGLIPTYIVVKSLHLINSVWALILPGLISTWLLILMRNFFQGIPMALRESARMDGASELSILLRIILPLALPMMATLTLFYGVGHWNEYTGVVLYINNNKVVTLQVLLRNMYTATLTEIDSERLPPPVDSVRAAAVMIATLPIVCVYPFLQKYFVQGMMVGSVKG